MANKRYSFWGLLTDYSIEIPIIQRDYAQGRKNEKVNFIRKELLSKLFITLTQDQPLTFDFVYGNNTGEKFIPLDGQQRLTTLYLLHWYLAVKDRKVEQVKSTLAKFSYETRISSRDFCANLINKGIKGLPLPGDKVSKLIEDSPWFFMSWKKDPTISSMLIMLDSIHEIFQESNGLFIKLIDASKCPIFFQYIQLDDYGLTDSLYIKMNARGKLLTTFENLKARFELLLEIKFPALHKEFSTQVDGAWTELLWKYKDSNWLIDQPFVRFFNYITETCFYKLKLNETRQYIAKDTELDFDLIDEIYSIEANVKFLIESLNLFCKLNSIPIFFANLFSGQSYVENKVALFEDENDMFKKLVNGGKLNIKHEILLYAIIKGLVHNGNNINIHFIDRIRVVRNLLERTRQRKRIEIVSNLRFDDSGMLIDIENIMEGKDDVYTQLQNGLQLISFKEALLDEKEKAGLILSNPELKYTIHQLEDHNCFRGSLFNLDVTSNLLHLTDFSKAVDEIWPGNRETSSTILRAMLSAGDYSVSIGGSPTIDADRYYLGSYPNWYTILVAPDKRVKNVLPTFLKTYSGTEGSNPLARLNKMNQDYLANNVNKDWRYYFVKYSIMTEGNSVYTFAYDDSNFQIRKLIDGVSITGEHINPYFLAVANALNDNGVCNYQDSIISSTDEMTLKLINGCHLKNLDEGWEIELPESIKSIDKTLIEKYSLENGHGKYLLREIEGKDRVEIAVDFVRELLVQES